MRNGSLQVIVFLFAMAFMLKLSSAFSAESLTGEASVVSSFPPDETFDELGLVLPVGWQTVPSSGDSAWAVTDQSPDSGMYAAHAADAGSTSDSSLTTPSFHVVRNGRLTFQHRVSLEYSYDGAVLEIQIAPDPAFHDIIAAGGRFVAGHYDHIILPGTNVLAGRPAWSGEHQTYSTVIVALPRSTEGQDIKVRWRVGTNDSFGTAGYWLDTVHVDSDGPPDDTVYADGFD